MAQVTYNPAKDWFEILRLAGGDHFKSTLSGILLINSTVSQIALDQAIIDNANGILSPIQTAINRDAAVDNITFADIVSAIAGDIAAIALISNTAAIIPGAVPGTTANTTHNYNATNNPIPSNDSSQSYSPGSHWYNSTTPSLYVCTSSAVGAAVWVLVFSSISTGTVNNFASIVPPILSNDSSQGYSPGSVWIDTLSKIVYTCSSSQIGNAVWVKGESISSRYVGSVLAQPASTLYVNMPLIDSLTTTPIGFSNISGVITSANAGDYLVSISVPFISLNKYELQNIRLLVDGVPIRPTLSTEAGKITKLGHISSTFTIHMNAQSTIAVQYSGTVGTIYECYLSITEVR